MPEVSVIIPNYNHAHYLRHAVQSVIDQTFKDWEAIIVDDGSTDNTRDVAAGFTDPRVRYIYQENQGLSAARNTGIRAARGRFLAFLDADDEWYPKFFSRCLETLGANQDPKIVGVYTTHVFIDQDGIVLPQPGNVIVKPERLPEVLLEGNFFPPCTVIVRTDIVQSLGMFDVTLTALEDKDLWLRLTRRYTLKGIHEILARYRVYPGSMSTNMENMHYNRMLVLEKNIGLQEGDPANWAPDKQKAYGIGYLTSALSFLRQNDTDRGWQLMVKAVKCWPGLFERVETFYELACSNQKPGYRGQAHLLDIRDNGAKMLQNLENLFFNAGPELKSMRPAAFGNAYLALSMLLDQAGDWPAGRRYLLRAMKANQRLVVSLTVLRRFFKLCLGQRVVRFLQKLQPHSLKKYPQTAAKSSETPKYRPVNGHD